MIKPHSRVPAFFETLRVHCERGYIDIMLYDYFIKLERAFPKMGHWVSSVCYHQAVIHLLLILEFRDSNNNKSHNLQRFLCYIHSNFDELIKRKFRPIVCILLEEYFTTLRKRSKPLMVIRDRLEMHLDNRGNEAVEIETTRLSAKRIKGHFFWIQKCLNVLAFYIESPEGGRIDTIDINNLGTYIIEELRLAFQNIIPRPGRKDNC